MTIKSRKELDALIVDVMHAIRVLNTRDGYAIPEHLIEERARNIVQILIAHESRHDA